MHQSRAVQADPAYDIERTAGYGPARQMAAEMVNVAIRDLERLAKRWQLDPTALARKDERSALAWIQNKASCAPFSFRWCLDVVGVDVDIAYARLMSWLRVAPQTQMEN